MIGADLEGTLTLTDTLHELIVCLLCKRPSKIWQIFCFKKIGAQASLGSILKNSIFHNWKQGLVRQ